MLFPTKRQIFNCLVLAAALTADVARAADPQPYNLAIGETGLTELDSRIAEASLLSSLRTEAPAPPFALIERARGDAARIEAALNSFGYYKPRVTISIAGHDLSDPQLPNILDGVAAGTSVDVRIGIDPGPLYRLRKIVLDGTVPPADRAALGLVAGQIAAASDVLNAQARLLAALQNDGYAFAQVEAPIADLDDAQHAVDLSFKVMAGPQSTIGAIAFRGLKDVHEDFVRETLSIHPGERYQPSGIEDSRQALLATGVFSGVSVRAAEQPSTDTQVPLTFDVQERPKHAVAFSANYSTDLGASISASWLHRNLLGNAEQLKFSAAVSGVAGNATGGLGYDLSAQFIKPRFLDADQTLEADLSAVNQKLDAYNQTAETLSTILRRKFSPGWSGSAGITAMHDELLQEGASTLYQLLSFPFTADYSLIKQPLADPISGWRASFAVTPTLAAGATDLMFVTLQGSGSAYFDFSGDGRSVLALRALAASIQGGSNFDLPPDQRLYAGGSATVRGFRYQSIGPSFADGKPAGATSVDAATVEFRQRITEDWGAALFVDAGQASANSIPFNGAVNAGAGIGVRYYTGIGAVRADIAVPLTHVPQGDSFEIYIGLGQVF